MALGGIDLNLLVVLQALLEEGNVTRAGVRLGMPQPAVSNALARLRRHYRDELLLRAGNGYDLTPLARSLLPAVQESTRLIGRTFGPGQPGQPPVGDRVFTICLSDYSMTVLGEPLVRRVHDLAPDARIAAAPGRQGTGGRRPRPAGSRPADRAAAAAAGGPARGDHPGPPRVRGRPGQPAAARQC